MKFHAPTRDFVVNVTAMAQSADELIWVIKHVRTMAGLPLEPYRHVGAMESAQFAEQGILDAASRLGIDLGATRHGQLDVRDAP